MAAGKLSKQASILPISFEDLVVFSGAAVVLAAWVVVSGAAVVLSAGVAVVSPAPGSVGAAVGELVPTSGTVMADTVGAAGTAVARSAVKEVEMLLSLVGSAAAAARAGAATAGGAEASRR